MNLIFFTGTYPYGPGEQWKKNEIADLIRHFDAVTVIPYSYGNNSKNPKQLPEKVMLKGPLFESDGFVLRKSDVLSIIFHRYVFVFFSEFFAKKVYLKKVHLINWMHTTLNIVKLLAHPLVKEVQQQPGDNTVLYFFWGKGSSDMLPFINTRRYKKIIVRMHRFDLFENASNNYIPYRHKLMQKKEILIAPCSDNGKEHLLSNYPDETDHIQTVRLGTLSNGKRSIMSNDGVMRIVSCSNLTPVKRVHLMIECLQYIDIPILWRHFGDGYLREELTVLAKRLNVNEKFKFEGFVNTDIINDLYTNSAIDLFINTSSSEGVPVSIMEAFASGIPVFATNVGGTSEIVDDTVGQLLPENVSPTELATAILNYSRNSSEVKKQMREQAYNRFLEKSNTAVLNKRLIQILKD